MAIAEYKRLLTEAYDLDKPAPPPVEIEYYRGHIKRATGGVLEAMCGSGRFLLPLLAEGVDIEGCDASPAMLDACARHAQTRGLAAPRLHCQLLQELRVPRQFGLIFCGGGSFGLIADDGDVARALTALRDHLLPGGTVLLEVETPRAAARPGVWSGRAWTRGDGTTITLRMITAYDPEAAVETGVGIYELFTNDGPPEVEVNRWIRRLWSPQEIDAALVEAGFGKVRVTRAFSTDACEGSEEMVSVRAER
jgi:hypothetical protein